LDPPPAASLVLLVINRLRFVPSLFAACIVSDVMVADCSPGISTAVATNAVAGIGYSGVDAVLLGFAGAAHGLPRRADIAHFLLHAGTGT